MKIFNQGDRSIHSLLFIPLFLLVSCSGGNNTKKSAIDPKKMAETFVVDDAEVFDVEHMLFNGKIKRFHTLDEFKTVFGEPDSTKLVSEEEPCTFIFENPDGSKDMNDRYLYKDGSRFENHRDSVALGEFRFYRNNYLKYKDIILNSSTTVDDLNKIFPNAMKKIEPINVYGEGRLQVISLREDENNVSEGQILIFIKNNRLYFMHWWFPC